MSMPFSDINVLAIIVAALINIAIAALWYSPNVFGKIWGSAHGFTVDSLTPTVWQYIGAVVLSLITAWVLALLIVALGVTSVGYAVELAFLLWLGFVAAIGFSGVIWAKKPLIAYLIDSGFHLLSLVIMSIILTLWR